MKQQVSRLSPHQNGKVFGVLSAVLSLIVLVPVFLLASLDRCGVAGHAALGDLHRPGHLPGRQVHRDGHRCALYNVVMPMTGGIEYDSNPGAA